MSFMQAMKQMVDEQVREHQYDGFKAGLAPEFREQILEMEREFLETETWNGFTDKLNASNSQKDFSIHAIVKDLKEKIKIARSNPSIHKAIGRIFSAAKYRMPTAKLSPVVKKIVLDAGLEACDLSEALNPNMSKLEMLHFLLRMFEGCRDKPNTVFFVTCDCVSSIESLLFIDDVLLKPNGMAAGAKYVTDMHGVAWRGEDYVRIATFGTLIHERELVQHMKHLTQPDLECPLCLEPLNEVGEDSDAASASITSGSHFKCGHQLCRKCYFETKDDSGKVTMAECPICREVHSNNAALVKMSLDAPRVSGKNKKKARAAQRRGR